MKLPWLTITYTVSVNDEIVYVAFSEEAALDVAGDYDLSVVALCLMEI